MLQSWILQVLEYLFSLDCCLTWATARRFCRHSLFPQSSRSCCLDHAHGEACPFDCFPRPNLRFHLIQDPRTKSCYQTTWWGVTNPFHSRWALLSSTQSNWRSRSVSHQWEIFYSSHQTMGPSTGRAVSAHSSLFPESEDLRDSSLWSQACLTVSWGKSGTQASRFSLLQVEWVWNSSERSCRLRASLCQLSCKNVWLSGSQT